MIIQREAKNDTQQCVARCKYCFEPGYDWCCPACFKQFEADDAYGNDEEEEQYGEEED